MIDFIRGALAMSSVVVSMYFGRAWKITKDRLFIIFAAAFLVMAVHWTILAISNTSTETQHFFYITRLLSYSMIVVAIVDKNRRP